MTALQYIHFSVESWGALFCIVAVVSIFFTRKFDKTGANKLINLMLASTLLMVSDALAWAFRGQATEVGYYAVRISNYCAFFFGLLVMPLVADYVSHLISIRAGAGNLMWKYVEWALFFIGAVLLTVNVFHEFIYTFDARNTYFRLTFGFLPGAIAFVGIVTTLGVALEYFKYFRLFEKIAVVAFLLLPMVAIVIQVLRYGIAFTNLAIVVSVLILYFSYIINYSQYNAEKEKMLAEERIRLVNRQIQPHFIFNSLSLIRHLCLKAPEEAAETIQEFSGYLRSSTNFLNETDCIPVEKEFDLVKHYIYMEQKRFKNISVNYALDDKDFEIPPFSLQTLVENAIKHGLRAKVMDNGLLEIKSFEDERGHVIEVTDNGAGFDVKTLDGDSKTHVGIKNTQERLRLMCGGRLETQSEPGEGTTARIIVPRRR